VSSEEDADDLTFYIDGIKQQNYSGEVDWTRSLDFPVTAGSHSFEWKFQKDASDSVGADSAWLDDIIFPMDVDNDGVIDNQDSYVPNAVVPAP
jgi:hypothetical protein